MDEMEIKTQAPPDLNELESQFDALRHLVVSILVLAVVVSGTLTIYLLRQWRFTHTELVAFRPQASPFIAQYQKERGPAMDQFLARLADYSKTHSDIIPILTRYGLRQVSPTNAVPMTSSLPPTVPAPKKK